MTIAAMPPCRCMLWLFSVILPAQALAVESSVRWEDVARSVSDHPAVAESLLKVMVRQGLLRNAGAVPNPTLELGLGDGRGRESGNRRLEWEAKVEIPLGWIRQRSGEMDAATAEVEAAERRVELTRRRVLAGLRSLFFQLLYDQSRLQTLEESQAQAEVLLSVVRQRVAAGEARPTDTTRIETEVERVRIELVHARAMSDIHREQLRIWSPGLGADFVAEGSFQSLPELPDSSVFQQTVVAENPQAGEARARSREKSARLAVQRNQRLPELAIGGFYASELDRSSVGGLLLVELPLWSWNTGGIEAAQAELGASERRAELVERRLRSEAIELLEMLRMELEVVRRHRDEILPRAERAVGALEKAFQVGETGLLDVLDARRVLLQAQREYQDALLELHLDHTQLLVLNGEIDHV